MIQVRREKCNDNQVRELSRLVTTEVQRQENVDFVRMANDLTYIPLQTWMNWYDTLIGDLERVQIPRLLPELVWNAHPTLVDDFDVLCVYRNHRVPNAGYSICGRSIDDGIFFVISAIFCIVVVVGLWGIDHMFASFQ